MTWEESFESDDMRLMDDTGNIVGSIQPVGATWEVTHKGQSAAIRPNKDFAMAALTRLHRIDTEPR